MRSFRNVLAGAAIAVLALATAAACSSSGSSAERSGGAAPSSSGAGALDPNAGGGAAWDKVVADANKEGSLTIYTATDGIQASVPPEFNKVYPKIKLNFVHYASGDLTTKLNAEIKSGSVNADVAMSSSKVWWDANTANETAATGPMIAKFWTGTKYTYAGDKYLVVGGQPLGIAVNNDSMSKLGVTIKAWSDLLNPALKGQIGLAPEASSPAGQQWWYFVMNAMGSDPSASVKKLAANKPRSYTGTTPLATDVASGEVAVGLPETTAAVNSLAKSGAPVKLLMIKPAVTLAGYAGIVGKKNPNAAQVFMNWLLSPVGQQVLEKNSGGLTALPLSAFGANVDTTVVQPIGDAALTDGILTDAQKQFMSQVFNPVIK